MTARGLGLVSLLVVLGIVGAAWALNARDNGPTSQNAKRVETLARQAASAMNFGAAAVQLQAYYAENNTYVGVSLPPSFGVQLIRADATSYCLQAGAGSAVQHLIGPGGQPVAGAC